MDGWMIRMQRKRERGKWIPFQMQIRSAGEDGRQAGSVWVSHLKIHNGSVGKMLARVVRFQRP